MTETKSNAHQLTVKKGILAIVAMYACQLLAGIAISYVFKIITPTNKVPLEIIGLASTLLSGILVLLLFWWDIHRSQASFYPQIGLQPSKIEKRKGLLLVIAALASIHFFAWIYRSVILPVFDQ